MVFEEMVQKILESSKLSRDELMSKIRAKQDELGGFVTLEGAANIVARELGIVFEHKEPEVRALRIEDLIPGMSKVDVLARVVRIREPREFQRSGGKPGQVGSIILQDSTGEVRLTLWDEKSSFIKQGGLKKGDIVRVQNAYVRQGIDKRPELSLGARGLINLCADHPRVKELPPISDAITRIADLTSEMREVDVAGRAVTTSDVRVFDRSDGTTGRVSTLILMDRTGQVRVSLWEEWTEIAKSLKRGEAVMLENAAVRSGLGGRVELSLGSSGRLVKNPPEVGELPELIDRPLKLGEVEVDMHSLDLAAMVTRKLPLREFKRGDGSMGKVASVVLADDTGSLRASFWDAAADLTQKMQVNDVVMLRNAYTRAGLGGRPEIYVGRATRVEINPPDVKVAEPKSHILKIGELEPNFDSIEVVGRVIGVTGQREFTRPDGTKGKVASIIIGDESGTARVSLWQEHAEKVDQIAVGDAVRLTDSYTTLGLLGQPELHLGKQGQLELNPSVELPPAEEMRVTPRTAERLEISEIEREGMQVQVRGTVIQVFHRRPIFDVCPSCGRSIGGSETSLVCEECGKIVTPGHRVVVSLLLDDGAGNIRVALFGDVAERLLGMDAQQVHEVLKSKPDIAEFYGGLKLVSRELVIYGTTKRDKYFDQLELRVSDFQVPDPMLEAKMLLKKLKETA
ncbi:MAG: DUF2240 family protein [Methanobacteriota archaeon]